MFVHGSLLVFAVALQIITAQGPPPGFKGQECHRPPPEVEKPFECCKFPPFFESKDFEECGFQKLGEGEGQGPRGPPPPPPDANEIDGEPNQNLDEDNRRPRFGRRHGGPWFGGCLLHHGWGGGRNCSKQLCLLQKYDLASDGEIKYDAISSFLDKYAESNPEFKDAVGIAKERCIGKNLPGPPHICEANKLVFCLSHTLFMECPTWQDTDNCKTLKDHIEKCKSIFSQRN